MITGDQALTACYVASQVHIVEKPALILVLGSNREGYQWISPDETETFDFRSGLICHCHYMHISTVLSFIGLYLSVLLKNN